MFDKQVDFEKLVVSFVNSKAQIVKRPLRDSVKQALQSYLLNFKDKNISNIYQLVLSETEKPLLDIIMQHTRGNQTQAALIMGINRGTLRKKLRKYGMN